MSTESEQVAEALNFNSNLKRLFIRQRCNICSDVINVIMGVTTIAYFYIIMYLISEVTFAAKDLNANSCRVSSASLLPSTNHPLL